jgi:hypothetical protein
MIYIHQISLAIEHQAIIKYHQIKETKVGWLFSQRPVAWGPLHCDDLYVKIYGSPYQDSQIPLQ